MIDVLVLWVTVVASLIAFFETLQNGASIDAKKATAFWLRVTTLPNNAISWRTQILLIFDSLFDSRLISRKFLFRSFVATLVGILISAVVIWAFTDVKIYTSKIVFEIIIILFAMIINLVPDYFSLVETRMVIGEIQKYNSKKSIVFFCIFDFFLTSAIYFLYLEIFLQSITFMGISGSINEFLTLHGIHGSNPFHGIFFLTAGLGLLSTYLTSIWVWVYSVTGGVFKLISYVGTPLFFLKNRVLDIEKYPFRAMGILSTLIFSFLYMFVIATMVFF